MLSDIDPPFGLKKNLIFMVNALKTHSITSQIINFVKIMRQISFRIEAADFTVSLLSTFLARAQTFEKRGAV